MELSKVQQEAVDFYTGCCNVIASAGSGKTKVLVNRIVKLIEDYDVEPGKILAITFSKKAKENMIERLTKMIPEYVNFINIETFHSFGYRIVRQFTREQFEILDAAWKKVKIIEEIMQSVYRTKKVDGEEVAKILHYISVQKNQMKKPDAREKFGKFYKKYEDYKSVHNQLDFDDMLTKCYEILVSNEKGLAYCQDKYRFILVDEMQDTNAVQYEILKLIGAKHKNVFVVDDPLQCWDGENEVKLKDGTIKKVKNLHLGDEVETAYEKKSNYFPISNISRSVCDDMIKIITESGKYIVTTRDHKFFAGYPLFTDELWYLYLMYRKDKGFRIGITSGGRNKNMQARVNSEHPERMWIIKQFHNKADAGYFENLLSMQYRIPTLPYFNVGRKIRLTQELLNDLFAKFGENGEKLLFDFNMDFNYPNYVPQDFKDKNNKFATIKLTSNIIKNKNCVSYEKDRVAESGLVVKKTFSNYKKAHQYSYRLKEQFGADMVVERMSADNRRMFNAVCAANLMPMMEILVSNNGDIIPERIKEVEEIKENRQVYNIEVAHTGNMIANGIVSHNCIFQWRGSDNRFVLEFDQEWPDAKTIQLNKNYRSSLNIVRAANHFAEYIPESGHIHYVESVADKGEFEEPHYNRFVDETTEAAEISKKVKELVEAGYRYNDIAVLTRTNAQLQYFETALYRSKIPYAVVNGLSFSDRTEIKIILSYLRLVCDINDDEAFEYIYNRPNRFLGSQFLQEVKRAARKEKISLFCAMSRVIKTNWRYKSSNAIYSTIKRLSDNYYKTVADMIADLREILDLDSYVSKDLSENDDSKVENLNTLQSMASNYKDVKRFVSFMVKFAKEKRVDPNSVQLMTIHKSKGLEFPVVFVAGVNQGILPHGKNENPDEEKRLMYVAITRAEKVLFVSSTQLYNGKEMQESEFISYLFGE